MKFYGLFFHGVSLMILSACNHQNPSKDFGDLHINQIQLIGSHNSYKLAIDSSLFAVLKKADSAGTMTLQYSHLPLAEQLMLGLRGLEIDFYADTAGGLFSHPKGLDMETEKDRSRKKFDPERLLSKPGFKVLHIQDIDFRSNCVTLEQCLLELRNWSDEHPGHDVVFITMNAKDDLGERPDFAIPQKFTSHLFDDLDRLILKILGEEKIISPDLVRGSETTLEEAVVKKGWPTVKSARGKFLFVLDETGEKRATYLKNHNGLKGRILFTNSEPGTPDAAVMIMNDPMKQFAEIQANVRKGYIVRTRADADTKEARTNDFSRFNQAQKSGAQIITTDYYRPSQFFPSTYVVHFDDDIFLRRNPFFATVK